MKISMRFSCRSNIALLVMVLVVFGLLCPEVYAKSVNSQQARKVVKGFLKSSPSPMQSPLGAQLDKIDTFTGEDGQVLYYVVYLKPSGFVIVSGDDLVEPIVGFSSGGSYDPSPENPLGALVTKDLPNRIAAVRKSPKSPDGRTEKAHGKWNKFLAYADDENIIASAGSSSISDVRVTPLVQSTWDQTTVNNFINGITCYNYYTPGDDPYSDGGYPCGCVATTMAQLMRYHEYPTGSVSTGSYQIWVDGISQYVSLFGGSYQWSDMPLVPDNSITLTQRQAIGKICRDAGVSVGMSYYSDGSSASLADTDDQLVDVFQYTNSIYGSNNNNEIGAGLINMINPNLDARFPVLLGIDGPGGGHAIVCDGYGYNSSTMYHHLNMGWSGSYDLWYDLPIIDSYFYFNVVDGCVYNIFTSGGGEIVSGRVVDMSQNPIPGAIVTAAIGVTTVKQATTNVNGIYALTGLNSNQSYTIEPSLEGHAFITQNITTGLSSDWQGTSGNRWSVDFTSQGATPPIAYDESLSAFSGLVETVSLDAADEGYPDPPGQLTYIITKLPEHGTVTDPLADEITSVPYTLVDNANIVEYCSCGYYAGQDTFQFVANDGGSPTDGGDSNTATVTIEVDNHIYTTYEIHTNYLANWPLYSSYHDARSQVIYLQSEIGGPKTITDLAININQIPGQTLNKWTIRMKHTSQDYYSGYPLLETSGWTTVYQANEPAGPSGWRYFNFQTPFEYNGSDNLLVDFSFNNTYSTSNGVCFVSDTGSSRVIIATSNSSDGDPLDWTSYTLSISTSRSIPNLKLISTISAEPTPGDFEYDCDVDLSDFSILAGAWLEIFDPNDPNSFSSVCDIADPNGIIDENDLVIFAEGWLR